MCSTAEQSNRFLSASGEQHSKAMIDQHAGCQPADHLLIVHNQDTPGHVATVSECLSAHGVNIATMQLYRSAAGGYAVMVLECDEPIPEEIAGELRSQPGIVKVTILNL